MELILFIYLYWLYCQSVQCSQMKLENMYRLAAINLE